jgi:SAM-dependent methyltransferase
MMNFKKSFFNLAYRGVPPWDTGRPNPEIVSLEETGWISGSVLDAGCGTGENALYLASRGHEVWGVDAAANAIRKAIKKAQERGIPARFLRADALKLDGLGRTFDTVVDCGLFHTFSDRERERYATSLSAVLRQEGKLALWCFSDQGTGTIGPRRVSQAEIRSAFALCWTVLSITPVRIESIASRDRVQAWLCQIVRQ